MAAPETSGLRCFTHARLIAWRVAKLSVQSSTTSAPRDEPRSPRQPLVDRNDRDVRIERIERAARGVDLHRADSFTPVQDLPLEIGEVDLVGIDQREAADAGRGEVERCRTAQPARADDQRVGGAQLLLSLDPDLRQQNVPAVAEKLLVVQVSGEFALV